MKSYISTLFLMLAVVFGVKAQIVTSEPSPLQQDSENIVIYYHADQGSKGLINQPEGQPIYAHTGVITTESTNSGDWKHAPSKWGDNSDKYKLTFVSTNLWKLEIGNIKDYYELEEGEEVVKLAFVFRNAACTKEGKTAEGGDIFLEVHKEGFLVALTSDNDGTVVVDGKTTVNFTAATSSAATISISVNGTEISSKANATTLTAAYTFKNRGNYTITAKAVSGSNEATDELVYCYPTNSVAQAYPGGTPKMGAVKNSDGTVTFCIAAPQKSNAMIIGSWDDYAALDKNVMKYHDYNGNRYFWITVSGLESGKQYPYYYMIDNKYKVGDPYAKLILDPYNDKYISSDVYPDLIPYPQGKLNANIMLAVYDETINDYDWKVSKFHGVDKDDLVIYEMLFRDFTGTEGKSNGDGTIRQAIEKIPYLKSLGINAVELMPIMEFNGNNSWGYNTNFYFAPDKAYGTPDDYKEFIDLCHKNGIAVILDIVFNQSDGLHPWYQMYPIASNPFYNEKAPHDYSVLNDWKQDNALVQQQFEDALQYWMTEYKVDGFRFDLVKGLGNNNSYGSGTEAYNQSRIDRMKKLHAAMTEVNPDAYFINENLASASEENKMAEDGEMNWANINNEACQFAMGWQENSNLNRMYAVNNGRTYGSTVAYCESHDEERMGYKVKTYGATGVKGNSAATKMRLGATAAQMILTPGAHMIWQFGELGNDQTTKNGNNNNTDPKIVNWSVLENAETEGLYNNYRELIGLRTMNPELFTQNNFSMSCTQSNWSNGRFIYASDSKKEIICVINPNTSGEKTFYATFKSKNNSDYYIASQSFGTTPTFDAAAGTVKLAANSYVVIVNNNTSGIEEIVENGGVAAHNVYAINGEIVVTGEYTSVEVYNMAGVRFSTLNVPAGFYVVRVDGKTYKVAVR